ncbi:DNA-formamidopyrimidine glycosylase [Enterococcus pseudoavium]|uniref:Formamidopyrimidine-DNA glycosylase n=1 Tax=Enterococcus pseudoavium TaxID=44007 RepID=A0ABU3FLD1_9ENTE|nr:DNA-formamidopyrimidine glycosylase [Enterococcus pseudoavium]MDT2755090.1 DNA-formamidopyrimidine glycosylase [Enterococcus pseudoavium]MDT2770829.1 DNA-formamidopyrimidine glycosylase [Enterococcus pseudoavium]
MPELPEVETVRKGLVSLVKGKTIAKVEVYWPRIVEFPEVERFQQQLVGETLETVDRRGKYLIFHFTHYELVSHLRMEGKYEFFKEATPLDKHSHIRFIFTDGSELIYHDVRKFGRMALLKKGTAKNYKGLLQLGPEPTEETFDLTDFKLQLKKSATMIKPLLLNQKVVAGLGNIYVDEVLWLAKIHPEQPANTLSSQRVRKLREAIIVVIEKAKAAGGTTIRTYLNALGEAGHFQQELQVYGQTGKPCPRCGTPIIKIKVAQRGTHLCPHCQKLKKV